jgi:hypothetical protein
VAEKLPKAVNEFRKRHPEVWKAFNELGSVAMKRALLTKRAGDW